MWWCIMTAAGWAWESQTTASGAPLVWWELPASWSYEPEGAPVDGEIAVDAAFEAWSTVPGTRVDFVASNAIDANVVRWDLVGDVVDEHLAYTSTWSDTDGILVAFDIALNPTVAWESGAFDLQSTLTHEVGHALGLDHSDQTGSVMAPTLLQGTYARELHEDDVDAVLTLYPDLGAPFATLVCSTGSVGAGPWVLALLLVLRRRTH